MTVPTLDDLKREVIATGAMAQDVFTQTNVEREGMADAIDQAHKFYHMEAFRNHHKSKKWWSNFVMLLMFLMIAFQCFLLRQVGAAQWDFVNYPWLIQALLVTNFAEIAALAMVIVKALHDHYKD